MLFPAHGLSAYTFTVDNWDTNPTSNIGTSVVPGASNVEGSWTQIASSATIAEDCYWMALHVHSGAVASQSRSQILDIGIDPAGGTSYTAAIENLDIASSGPPAGPMGYQFLLPWYVSAGSSIAARIQGSHATAGTVRVAARWWGSPSRPEAAPRGSIAQTFGTIASSAGTSFTPGNAADGSWVSLGTASSALWWLQLCAARAATTLTNEYTYVDLAVGDATNKRIIARTLNLAATTERVQTWPAQNLTFAASYCPIPSGAELWVRGRCDNAPDSGYHATVIGIGG